MADRFIFTPPDTFHAMVEDLRAVAEIPNEVIERLAARLQQQNGILSDDNVVTLVADCIEDDRHGSAAFNALQNLQVASIEQTLEMLSAWRESDERNRQQFPDELLAALREKLPLLIREYPALARSKKANRLRVVLGNEFKGVVFICDARPVYNEGRDRIEALIPLTTMKLVYEEQNLDTEEIEIVLTGEQLGTLISRATQAEQKLNVLHERISEWIPGNFFQEEEGE